MDTSLSNQINKSDGGKSVAFESSVVYTNDFH